MTKTNTMKLLTWITREHMYNYSDIHNQFIKKKKVCNWIPKNKMNADA